ncbi:type II toxin-antitoxin system RelE/ParE family toxin [Roseibium sediminicola]|uniref:type II toxin-antitoxin system RelE/ParE family toxin n=1 Tax=Roseibium sediminicola TaxID=2933272 RepID=UPI003CE45282
MRRLQFTPAAEQDLNEIWQYTVDLWGRQQAVQYVRDLKSSCQALARDKLISQSAEHVRPGYRKAKSGKHVLYFRETNAVLIIVRILHERMDPDLNL